MVFDISSAHLWVLKSKQLCVFQHQGETSIIPSSGWHGHRPSMFSFVCCHAEVRLSLLWQYVLCPIWNACTSPLQWRYCKLTAALCICSSSEFRSSLIACSPDLCSSLANRVYPLIHLEDRNSGPAHTQSFTWPLGTATCK